MLARTLIQNIQKLQFLNKVNRYKFHTSKRMMRGDDLYGVNKQSDQNEIKKAYYKLAQQYHPDKNPSEEAKIKFQKIREAYDTLGDEQKRRTYDTTGIKDGEQGADPFGGFGGFWQNGAQSGRRGFDEEIFEDFAQFFNMDGQQRSRNVRGADIIMNVEISFMESVNGIKKDVVFEKRGVCKACSGSKCKSGTAPTKCAGCGGKGTVNFRQGPMTIQMSCSKCKGLGSTIKTPCPTCKGSGIGNEKVTETVNVPKGISNGQNLRISQKGSESDKGGPAGDLVLKIVVLDDPYFKRDNFDVITDHHITISQAVLGFTSRIKTLYGEREISIKPGTQHGTKYRLSGQGITKLAPHHDQRGDHIVMIKVQIPTSLTQQQNDLFKQLNNIETKIDPQQNLRTSDEYTKSNNNNGGGRKNPNQAQEQQEEEDIFGRFKNMFR